MFDYGGVAGGLGGIRYVRVPDALGVNASLTPVRLANYPIGDANFVDISSDGWQVLVLGDGSGRSNGGLSLWDTRLPKSDSQFAAWADVQFILDGEVVAGAAFLPGDSATLLVLVKRGIVLYDVETGQLEMINSAINADWVDWAYFSPDGEHVVTWNRTYAGSGDIEHQRLSLFRVTP